MGLAVMRGPDSTDGVVLMLDQRIGEVLFRAFIESIERGADKTRDLPHCSLEHRCALRAAFEAGRKAGKQ